MSNPLRISSLRTRILVLTAVPSMVLLAGFLAGTLLTAENAVRHSVQRSLSDAGSVFVKLLATRRNELMTMASVTARDPRFFATFAIPEEERGAEFGPTMEGIGLDFLRITDADFIEIFDGRGRFLAYVDRHLNTRPSTTERGRGAIQEALGGTPTSDFFRDETHLVVAAVVPVFASHRIEAIVRLGTFFDRDFVDEVKRLTGAEVSLTHGGTEIASTFAEPSRAGVAGPWPSVNPLRLAAFDAFTASEAFTTTRGGTEYLAVRVHVNGVDQEDGFDAYLGRELETELQPMVKLSAMLGLAGAGAARSRATPFRAWQWPARRLLHEPGRLAPRHSLVLHPHHVRQLLGLWSLRDRRRAVLRLGARHHDGGARVPWRRSFPPGARWRTTRKASWASASNGAGGTST